MDRLKSFPARLRLDGEGQSRYLTNLRRWFHQNPEIGRKEFRTTARLKRELQKLGLKIFDGHGWTGLWAQLNTGRPGPVVAVRTDLDALPIREESGLPFASRQEGVSHACGHDLHMAAMVGAARLLTRYRDRLAGTVKFIGQPAEEVPPGGARDMIAAGVLKNPPVDVILAMHVDPMLPTGTIGLRDGVTMAATFDFDIKVTGVGGHAALPHRGVDAIAIAAEIVTGIQQIVSRRIDPMDNAVISFGTIRGGNVRNSLANEVCLQGTARSLDLATIRKLPGLIKRTAVGMGKGLGAKVEVIPIAEYPLLVSDGRVNRYIADSFSQIYSKGKIVTVEKILGGEDFACYLEKVPGAMFRLGIRNRRLGADKPWHHPAFRVDEAALPIGSITMAATVVNFLRNWKSRS